MLTSRKIMQYTLQYMEMKEIFFVQLNIVLVSDWAPGWSPEIALADFAEPPMIFENGQYKTVPIFSRDEDYQFPEPFGKILIASHSHEEPYTLPYYIGKNVKEVDFKYPILLLGPPSNGFCRR